MLTHTTAALVSAVSYYLTPQNFVTSSCQADSLVNQIQYIVHFHKQKSSIAHTFQLTMCSVEANHFTSLSIHIPHWSARILSTAAAIANYIGNSIAYTRTFVCKSWGKSQRMLLNHTCTFEQVNPHKMSPAISELNRKGKIL